MKNIYSLIFLCLFSTVVFAQSTPIKWKKLSKEEIELKSYATVPDASAVVLYDYGEIYFDVNSGSNNLFIFNERHLRIKILTEDGKKYGYFKIPYHDMHCEEFPREMSFDIKALTHNIEKGKIKTTKLNYKDIKQLDSSKCMKIAVFELPDLKAGSIIEVKYKIPTLHLKWPESWVFQRDIPVMNSEFRARIPHNFAYHLSVQNNRSINLIDSVTYDKIIVYETYYNLEGGTNKNEMPSHFSYPKSNYKYNLNFSGTEYIFKDVDIPPEQDPKLQLRLNIHLMKLMSQPGELGYKELTSALYATLDRRYHSRTPKQRKLITYPTGYVIYKMLSWDQANLDLLDDQRFGLALMKHWDTDTLLSKIISEDQSNHEKTKAIYAYVRKKTVWNYKHDIYVDLKDSDLKKIYSKTGAKAKMKNLGHLLKSGGGSSSEINFILIHLLFKAGIKVNPVLVNTKTNYLVDRNIPEVRQFKTVMAAIETDQGHLFLDAANPESSFEGPAKVYLKTEKYIVSRTKNGWVSD